MCPADLLALPSNADLRRLINFSASDGRIWLAGHRMLLMHAEALGAMRREMIECMGREQTRRVFMRVGHASGKRDAALARQVRPDASVFDLFAVGPQLHMLEGAVKVSVEKFDIDIEKRHHHAIFRWDYSWEVDTHLRDFGPQTEPVCWMLVGYASGYVSSFMGFPILYRETQCGGCGHDHCRIEGRPAADWPDGEERLRDYDADSLIDKIADLRAEVETLRSTLAPRDELGELVGRSRAFSRAADLMRKAATTQVTVLLTGETGVGKERFARALHAMSPRADQPFVAINCAALPADLIESELFGAEKGAFTGADCGRAGRFERADGGTLFLDELGELPLPAQAKLLRALQTGEIERLGGTQPRHVDVRVIAATNVDLDAAVAGGAFRRDLLYRLNVFPIRIPPLRERQDDIAPLADHLLHRFAKRHQHRIAGITDRALDAMRRHDWPGNVREMENLIERAVIVVGQDDMLDVEDIFPALPGGEHVSIDADGSLERCVPLAIGALYDDVRCKGLSLDELEDALIREAVRRCDGNLSAAARELGMTRPQLSYRLGRARDRSRQ